MEFAKLRVEASSDRRAVNWGAAARGLLVALCMVGFSTTSRWMVFPALFVLTYVGLFVAPVWRFMSLRSCLHLVRLALILVAIGAGLLVSALMVDASYSWLSSLGNVSFITVLLAAGCAFTMQIWRAIRAAYQPAIEISTDAAKRLHASLRAYTIA